MPEILSNENIITGALGIIAVALAVWVVKIVREFVLEIINARKGNGKEDKESAILQAQAKLAEGVVTLQRATQDLARDMAVLKSWHKPGQSGIPEDVDFRAMEQRVKQIHDLLSVRDSDGVPMIYTRMSLYKAIDRMTSILERIEAEFFTKTRRM